MSSLGFLLLLAGILVVVEAIPLLRGTPKAAASGNTGGAAGGGGPPSPATVPSGGVPPPTSSPGDGGSSAGSSSFDSSSRQAFVQSAYPVAQQWQQLSGIPADLLVSIMGSESNFGRAPGNVLFGIKGPGATLATWEQGEGGVMQSFSTYPSPAAAFNDFFNLVRSGRYAPAWQQFQATGNAAAWIQGVNAAGYATNPHWWSDILALRQSLFGGQQT